MASRKAITRTFIQGAAAVLPVVLTLWFIVWAGGALERLLKPVFLLLLPDGWYLPGLGILLGLAIIYAAGLVVNSVLGRLVDVGDQIMDRIPGVKTVYGGLKDLFHFLAGGGQEDLEGVVRVEVAEDVHLIGFLTGNVSGAASPGDDTIAVYLPMSYQIGGFTVLVPKDRVSNVDMSVETAMRKTLTAWIERPGSGAGKDGD